jgi:hypothetical protein
MVEGDGGFVRIAPVMITSVGIVPWNHEMITKYA